MSAPASVRVHPEAYQAACTVIGEGLATSVFHAGWQLVGDLAGGAGMAGSDPVGASWAAPYDRATETALEVTADVVNACYRLAGLLQQTGFNYGRAETASVPGAGEPSVPDRSDYAERWCSFTRVPTAAGGSGSTPFGWWLIEHTVGYVWPNGHQGQLRAAASSWTRMAHEVDAATDDIPRALAYIEAEDSPEVADAESACRAMREQLTVLAATCTSMATACENYAAHLDAMHSDVEHELSSLAEWTVTIETIGAVGSIITFGGSEAAAQAAETSRIAATAVRVAGCVERLAEFARVAAETVSNVTSRVAQISLDLNPLLTSRIVVAMRSSAEELPVLDSAAQAAESRLVVASELDLAKVPEAARPQVIDAVERARFGKVRFPAHDGKNYENRNGYLPDGCTYTEWTAAPNQSARGTYRVIFAGDPENSSAVYYWDHITRPIQIGP
jgi:guanyl-specific ribonuclease Sa